MSGHFIMYKVRAAQVQGEVLQSVSSSTFNVLLSASRFTCFYNYGLVTIMNNDNEERTLTKIFEFLYGKLKNYLEWPK